jgi:PTS system nitrogen regulatory IIA component
MKAQQVAAATNPVGRYFCADDIVLDISTDNKPKVLSEVALLAERRHHIDHDAVERALWRREQAGSTGVGHGFAIPHARIPGLSNPIVLFVRTQKPIKFGALDRKPVANLFVILVPVYATEEHLRILAAVSSMFSSETFRSRLAAATDPAEAYRLFSEWPVD